MCLLYLMQPVIILCIIHQHLRMMTFDLLYSDLGVLGFEDVPDVGDAVGFVAFAESLQALVHGSGLRARQGGQQDLAVVVVRRRLVEQRRETRLRQPRLFLFAL